MSTCLTVNIVLFFKVLPFSVVHYSYLWCEILGKKNVTPTSHEFAHNDRVYIDSKGAFTFIIAVISIEWRRGLPRYIKYTHLCGTTSFLPTYAIIILLSISYYPCNIFFFLPFSLYKEYHFTHCKSDVIYFEYAVTILSNKVMRSVIVNKNNDNYRFRVSSLRFF